VSIRGFENDAKSVAELLLFEFVTAVLVHAIEKEGCLCAREACPPQPNLQLCKKNGKEDKKKRGKNEKKKKKKEKKQEEMQ
jgi:hypothetical protein